MEKNHEEKIEIALADLNSTLHKECIDTGLITLQQWNEGIAPKLSKLSNVIRGLYEDSPTPRNYKLSK